MEDKFTSTLNEGAISPSESGIPFADTKDRNGRERTPKNDDLHGISRDSELVLIAAILPSVTAEKSAQRSAEEVPDVHSDPQMPFRTYWTRFWVVALFAAFNHIQFTVWGTWAPILESALEAFPSWSPGTVSSFSNWAPFIGLFFMLPLGRAVQRIGLRKAMLMCCALLAGGTFLRCLPVDELTFLILSHVQAAMLGVASCTIIPQIGALVSAWFPPGERTSAIAFIYLMAQLGGVSMYFAPLVVRAPGKGISQEDIRGDIMNLMYIHFGLCFLVLLCAFLYFPDRPPSPPSHSAELERERFLDSLKDLLKNRHLVILVLVYGVSFGVVGNWLGLMNFSLLEIDIHQDEAMGVAISASLCSSVAAFVAGRLTDRMYGHLKVTIVCLLGGSFFCFLWFFFLSTKVIAPTLVQVYLSVTLGVSLEFASVPLLMELGFEMAFPISEGVVGASFGSFFSAVAIVFILLFLIPNIGYLWVSYVLLFSVSLSIVPFIFVKERHKRRDVDEEVAPE